MSSGEKQVRKRMIERDESKQKAAPKWAIIGKKTTHTCAKKES